MRRWLGKIRRYDGSDSIMLSTTIRSVADDWAANRNDEEQTSNYYVEEYEPNKVTGWVIPDHVAIVGKDRTP